MSDVTKKNQEIEAGNRFETEEGRAVPTNHVLTTVPYPSSGSVIQVESDLLAQLRSSEDE